MQDILKDKDILIEYISNYDMMNYNYIIYLNDTDWDRIILNENFVKFFNDKNNKCFTHSILRGKFLNFRRIKKLEKIFKKCSKRVI